MDGPVSLIWPQRDGPSRPHRQGVEFGCDGLFWPHLVTRRGLDDGLRWTCTSS